MRNASRRWPKQITPLTEQFINKYLYMHMHAHLWFHILLVLFSLIIVHATVNQHQQQQKLSCSNCARGKYKQHLIAEKSRVSPYKYIFVHNTCTYTYILHRSTCACHMPHATKQIRLPQKCPSRKWNSAETLQWLYAFTLQIYIKRKKQTAKRSAQQADTLYA